jgi:hypothetical protein
MVLAALAYAARNAFRTTTVYPELVFALSMIATALVSYHIFLHDMSILFLTVLIVLEALLSSQVFHAWSRRAILGCIGILFCSPVYILLTLRYRRSELMGAVLLLFFVVLFVEFVRAQPTLNARPAPVLANPELQ